METDGPKTKRLNAKPKVVGTVDLIVMNLPFKLEEDAMRQYFETFGEMVMVQLKKDLEGTYRTSEHLTIMNKCFNQKIVNLLKYKILVIYSYDKSNTN